MGALILRRNQNLAERTGAALSADSQYAPNPVANLRTSIIAEVFRAPGIVEATSNQTTSTDSNAGATKGANTTRNGTVAGSDGTANRAVSYSNSATGSAFVAVVLPVKGGRRYQIQVNARRISGTSVAGSAIIVAQGPAGRTSLPMSALAQGTAWQVLAFDFVAAATGNVTIYFVADTGALSFALDGAALFQLLSYPAGSRTLQITLDAGAALPVNVSALACPPDSLLVAAGTIRLRGSNLAANGADAYDSGAVALALDPLGMAVLLPPDVTARYWWLEINWTSGEEYFQAGRWMIGDGLKMRPMDFTGHSLDVEDGAALTPRRVDTFGLSFINQPGADALIRRVYGVGTQVQVLVVPRGDRPSQTAIIGRLRKVPMPSLQGVPSGRLYQSQLTIAEDR